MKSKSITLLPAFLVCYSLLWLMAVPFLFFVKRLRPVNWQRFGLSMPAGPFRLWIQASSVGEAKLAVKLISKMPEHQKKHILVTTNTAQGMQTLQNNINPQVSLAYFPFDMIFFLIPALHVIKPEKILLMETEIWPGLLWLSKIKSIPVIIGNARMSLKSFCRYLSISSVLERLNPHTIAAVSELDKFRFARIFPSSAVSVMPNIKFDILRETKAQTSAHNRLSSLFSSNRKLIVLGSIRRQEEHLIQWLINQIVNNHNEIDIALFPRHMTRLEHWDLFLSHNKITWTKRTSLTSSDSHCRVILWDKFGEMLDAYGLAENVYVGGSLIPCGGQNFLEPVSQGVVPCVGPYWNNFNWVGKKVFDYGLVNQVKDIHELYSYLIKPQIYSNKMVMDLFAEYLSEHKHGTKILLQKLSNQ